MSDLDLQPTAATTQTALPLFTAEHDALRQSARAFVARELTPHADEWEANEDYPREVFRTVGQAGFLGLKFAERWGGSGGDVLATSVWLEEVTASNMGGLNADLGAHADLGCLYVDRFGNDGQRARYLVPGIAGEQISALAVTEPGAGSDVAAITTRAVRDGDDWILNGSKVFITNGPWADWVVVAAKTDVDASHGGISLFVVDRGTPGFESRRLKMLGWRTSHTGELSFTDVRLPAEALVGEANRGFYYIMQNFEWERLMLALGAVAQAQVCLDAAIAYARERNAFGRPVASFQVWRHRFADLATEIATGRAMTYHALRMHAAGEPALREVAMAKLLTQRLACKAADECVQVHGGNGYTMDYPAQRWWRDARLGPIGGGTDEIMREIIAKTLGY